MYEATRTGFAGAGISVEENAKALAELLRHLRCPGATDAKESSMHFGFHQSISSVDC